MSTEIRHTLRASFADGRQAALVDGHRKRSVRVFDESPEGLRVATIRSTTLFDGAETTL